MLPSVLPSSNTSVGMTFLLTSSPDDSTSFVDTATSFTCSGSSDDVPSPDPLEIVSDFAVPEASVFSDDSSSSGLNILGISLLLEYSKQI